MGTTENNSINEEKISEFVPESSESKSIEGSVDENEEGKPSKLPKETKSANNNGDMGDGLEEGQKSGEDGGQKMQPIKSKGGDDETSAADSTDQRQASATLPVSPATSRFSTDTNVTASTPGAFAVEGYASRERNRANAGNNSFSDNPQTESDIESSPVLEAEVSICVGTTGSTTGPSTITGQSTRGASQATTSNSEVDISTAYLVEETTVHGEATVVKTLCGIDRKYFVIIFLLAIGTMIAVVLGINPNRGDDPQPIANCGPLCGSEGDIPNPEKIVLGLSCEDWSLASLLPDDVDASSDGISSTSSCENRYAAAAYACGCPNAEIPSNGCGSLCSSGASLPDPDKLITDVHGTEMTCSEWELMSQFDIESNDFCANYNAVGVLCGCEDNFPPADACGPLCENDALPRPSVIVWGMSCEDWNTMSKFLPAWQAGDGESETCSQIFQDVAYRCECPEVEPPPDECNVLCQERSFCGASMCQNDSQILYPDKVVRGLSCKNWSFFSRLTDHPEMCYFYEMIGAECGCNSTPPSNACGPLCGGSEEIVPHPSRVIRGQTCDEWNSMSTFLFPGYGEAMPGTTSMISSTCDAFFSPLAYGCGCPSAEPPEDGCGSLCKDGLPVPNPDKIVGDQTCGDYELKSLFETDSNTCYRYRTNIAKQCGCADENSPEDEYWSMFPCFSTDNLDNETFYYFSGMSQYAISFGENGTFLQIQSQDSFIPVGKFAGFETITDAVGTNGSETQYDDDDDVETPQYQASYGGGDRCGQYGPRRGSVVLVEDESIVVPEITSVIEPSICVYKATLKVPNFC